MAAAATPLTMAECADGASLPPGAAALLASLPPYESLPDDALFALVVVLLAESGFVLADVDPGPMCCEDVAYYDEGFNARRVAALRELPAGWRRAGAGGAARSPPQRQVALCLPALPQHRVRLVGVSVGGALIANLLLQPGGEAGPRSLCVSLRAARFLEPTRSAWRPQRLAELSRRVKDALATPARCDILRAEGLRHPALNGLPEEVLLRIAQLLPAPALLALGRTSKNLLALSREPRLWRALLRCDFGVPSEGAESDAGGAAASEDPYAAYRRRYESERIWWRDRHARERWLRNMRHTDRRPSSDSDSSLPPPAPLPPVWYLRVDTLQRRGPGLAALPRAASEAWRVRRHHQRAGRRPRPARALVRGVAVIAAAYDDTDADADVDTDDQFRDASSDESFCTRTSQSTV